MQLKDVMVALAIPAVCSAAAIPQDPTFPDDGDFPENPIVGGTAAVAGDFPFIVSVQRGGSHFCGGSLVNANTVVTAAHCAAAVNNSPSGITVRGGTLNRSSGGVVSAASSIKPHPSYSGSPRYYNDIAIIKLSTPIPTSSTISYATLAAAGSDPASGTSAITAGWGVTTEGGSSSPAALRKVTVPIIDRTTCRSMYSATKISDNMVCAGFAAGGKDSCQGDSGGPLIDASTSTLLGVVSWGDGCARPNLPGVYAHIGVLNGFVTSNM
ncbi:trypsin-like cysteine/serine peptidase domain-containing protein [Phaeosphaeriaceae sp. PMI808]|nr:trypsin-like cysteine/serine peptidase domain-containing protein [Phaeosphaeriaceae sp. PMI808]